MKWHSWAALSLGLIFHFTGLAMNLQENLTTKGFSLQNTSLVSSVILVASCFALEIFSGEIFFTIFILPIAIALLIISGISVPLLEGPHFRGPWFLTHVGFSIAGECFFFMASVSAIAYLFVVRKLKSKNRLRAMYFFPSLARLDNFTLWFVGVGFILFSIGISFGCFWSWYYFGGISLIETKKAISLGVMLFFAIILLGSRAGKIAGPKLAILSILGFLTSLALAIGVDSRLHWFPQWMISK